MAKATPATTSATVSDTTSVEIVSSVGGVLLSPVEYEMIGWIAVGETSGEIASRTGVSVRTIEARRAKVMAKLNAPSVQAVTAWALYHKIISFAQFGFFTVGGTFNLHNLQSHAQSQAKGLTK
jgi:DNA-binding CsgD family transcriptional regulator